MHQTLRIALLCPLLALGGCATVGVDSGVSIGQSGPYDFDPYTLEPWGANAYGYDMGMDPYGYPYAGWYSGYGGVYPGYYLIGPSAVLPYAGLPGSGVAPLVHPHPGPSPRPGTRAPALDAR